MDKTIRKDTWVMFPNAGLDVFTQFGGGDYPGFISLVYSSSDQAFNSFMCP